MMKQLIMTLGLGLAITPLANAGEFKTALSAGQVCENNTGYVQATPGNEGNQQVADLVVRINKKRTKVYSQIASTEGADPTVVAATSAEQERAKNPANFCR